MVVTAPFMHCFTSCFATKKSHGSSISSSSPKKSNGSSISSSSLDDSKSQPSWTDPAPPTTQPDTPEKLSPLVSRLPREIREMIWEKLVVNSTRTTIVSRALPHRTQLPHWAHACHQIYREVSKIFFEHNTFYIMDDTLRPEYVDQIRRLARLTGSTIRKVRISRRAHLENGTVVYLRFLVESTAGGKELALSAAPGSSLAIAAPPRSKIYGDPNEQCHCEMLSLKEQARHDPMEFVFKYLALLGRPSGPNRDRPTRRYQECGICGTLRLSMADRRGL